MLNSTNCGINFLNYSSSYKCTSKVGLALSYYAIHCTFEDHSEMAY